VLRSLRSCQRQVESEIKKYRQRSAGEGEGESPRKRRALSWEETRQARLRGSLEQVAERRPELMPRVGLLLEGVLGSPPAGPAELDSQEGFVFLALLRALPFPERRQLWREARVAADGQGMSARSRRVGRRFRLLALVRRTLEMKEV
jgi:hypothetical protein